MKIGRFEALVRSRQVGGCVALLLIEVKSAACSATAGRKNVATTHIE
jgi:hypothetical protein